MKHTKLGLVSVSFRGKSPEEILVAAKNTGLSFIEWGSDVHLPKDELKTAENIAKQQEQCGIRCSSYGTYFRLGVHANSELSDYAKVAKILGTNVLRVWCGVKNSEEYTDDEKQEFFAVCKNAAEIASRNGVVLCMECHNDTYTNRMEAAIELMREVNSESFKMYWQPNQYRTEEENLCYAKAIAPYTVNIHVFNWKGDGKYPLCKAKDIWQGYLSHFGGEETLLLEFMPDDNIESLKTEVEALKEIVE